ncbi:hypothetical protein LINGRAHAP2_LOCUS6720 [Linum grandiflorum]
MLKTLKSPERSAPQTVFWFILVKVLLWIQENQHRKHICLNVLVLFQCSFTLKIIFNYNKKDGIQDHL